MIGQFTNACRQTTWYWTAWTSNQNQIIHNACCTTPKRVTSLRAQFRITAPTQHRFFRRNVTAIAEPLPLATLCSIWPPRDLNLVPSASETNTLPLDQLAGIRLTFKSINKQATFTWTVAVKRAKEILLRKMHPMPCGYIFSVKNGMTHHCAWLEIRYYKLGNTLVDQKGYQYNVNRSVVKRIKRMLQKGTLGFHFRSSQTKHYKNWYSQLPCLTFSIKKEQCEASTLCGRQVDICNLTQTPKVPYCLLAEATWWIKI